MSSQKTESRHFKIAIVGTRGIPANYGGFETFAEELSTRLAARGHQASVYSRKGTVKWTEPYYKGVRVIQLPTIRNKYLDTVFNTLLSTVHVMFSDVEIVYFCNAINSVYTVLPRLTGKKSIINVDGLEWKRKKWSRIGKMAYQISEWLATFLANEIISDSKRIQLYYKKKFRKETIFISYGANPEVPKSGEEVLKRYGLKKYDYLIYVSRFEPENNAHLMIQAYEKVKTDKPLVMVGDAPYSVPYIRQLRETKDSRIKFLGSIYGEDYRILKANAYVYLHGNEVGGTNPALLEAMALGTCVIANGVGFNREVIGGAGLWFRRGSISDLKEKIEFALAHPDNIKELGNRAVERIKTYYNWDLVTEQYEKFFSELSGLRVQSMLEKCDTC